MSTSSGVDVPQLELYGARTLNPAGKVPVLVGRSGSEAPDFILTQSNAILFYAEDRSAGRLLPSAGRKIRAACTTADCP
jgi:glutathione S-transferase